MRERARVAFRAGYGRLRQVAVCILLLAIGALVLQTPAHAGPAGHAIHQQQSAATAGHCTQHHMLVDHGAGSTAGCVSADSGVSLVDCCQACLIAAVPVEPPALGVSASSEVFLGLRRDFCGRSPEGILKPPRLIAA